MITAQVIILGGGPAGLACAFYAQKKNKKTKNITVDEETDIPLL